ncbi:MAG TPA: sulfite exporter TauE/SafE family protein [Stellaceae bacterium]|nr:sulfite exporter TauE/SafE family protein [Stellaceae bacterium]
MANPFWLAGLVASMAATGLVSGTLAGLLGVGGGIVIVPVLFNVLPLLSIPVSLQMKIAVATSLATIIPTSIISARRHYAKGAIDTSLLKAIWPSMIFGVVIGTILAIWLKGNALTVVFAAIALLVALNMGLTGVDFKLRDQTPRGPTLWSLGTFIGGISAMMGIGGGTVGVPILSIFGTPIRSAVATSSVFGLIISIPATVGFLYGGWDVPGLPPFSLGFINLIGFILIVPSSLIATPWGVHLAHTIPPLMLKRAFALFLAITSIRMFYGVLF